MIGQVRSEDATHLKKSISRYTSYDSNGLEPAIFPDSKDSCTKMGLNHPQLVRMLCPVKHLVEYQKSPSQTKSKIESGKIKMDSNAWPALLYNGKVAGEPFIQQNMQDGLFEGYIVEHVVFSFFNCALVFLINIFCSRC
ncbi:uncharacterized protein F5891DRAFT_941926 [Suillus fuscotomentosus]|uniref:Uncharacterized protein n=1 Tax=Suillus fuscotomentosus TaxID=1912939 RepID=A0AAD4HS54_9AGAM|nr:uncharacterized protein F5891DRAFT_941926 [Suillus fuscotomentosus]KAG1906581.1 hypothetical protein F5891DRAFT_941926 [Suillus fuscotomentosus]